MQARKTVINGYVALNKEIAGEIIKRNIYSPNVVAGIWFSALLTCALLPALLLVPALGWANAMLIAGMSPMVLFVGGAVAQYICSIKKRRLTADIANCHSSEIKAQLTAKLQEAERNYLIYDATKTGVLNGMLLGFCMLSLTLFFPQVTSFILPVCLEFGGAIATTGLIFGMHKLMNWWDLKGIAVNDGRIKWLQQADHDLSSTTGQLRASLAVNPANNAGRSLDPAPARGTTVALAPSLVPPVASPSVTAALTESDEVANEEAAHLLSLQMR